MAAGKIVLEGGAEFGGGMAEPDRRAIALAGGPDVSICIIPTAAAPDHNERRAGGNGIRWFQSLGASRVVSLPLVDSKSANDPALTGALREARLIYLLGGFTHYLGRTLAGSVAWSAVLEAFRSGAVIAGSSAGAMVLCEYYYDPDGGKVERGLGLVPLACVIPHHNRFGAGWAPRLASLLPDVVLIGIDEETGMIDDAPAGGWTVYGKGAVTLYRGGEKIVAASGEIVNL
ncbi:MAG: cyanophycinase [Rudaea sp.]